MILAIFRQNVAKKILVMLISSSALDQHIQLRNDIILHVLKVALNKIIKFPQRLMMVSYRHNFIHCISFVSKRSIRRSQFRLKLSKIQFSNLLLRIDNCNVLLRVR